MIYAYPNGGEFCTDTFCGDREEALRLGYVEVPYGLFMKIYTREAHWVDGELVEREKPQSEIDEEENHRIRYEKDEQIRVLKERLSSSDYKAIKYAEGWILEEDYAEIKAERESIRAQIRELEL